MEEGEEKSSKKIAMEDKIAGEIRAQIKSGKLKDSHMKKFLSSYYTGDPDCKDCKGCSKDELTECYLDIQQALVDDKGAKHPMSEHYESQGHDMCCGNKLKAFFELGENKLLCEICGNEYKVED